MRRTSAARQTPPSTPSALENAYVRWMFARALLHRGWWLATSVYMVVDAGLTPAQLVVIGAAQSVVALLCEVPAGVLADTISRKWSLVLSHVLMGSAMLSTGLVESFPALLATQLLWGLSWTFASGADVAWITDELDQPDRIPRVLARGARAQLIGSATGLLGIGLLAWATRRDIAIVLAGTTMLLLGLYVLARFRETKFVPTRTARWTASLRTFVRGVGMVRRNRELLLMFAATFLINGADDAWSRAHPKQLLDVGLPTEPDPIVWFTGLGCAALVVAALVLRIVDRRIDGTHVRNDYAIAAAVGAIGMAAFAFASGPVVAGIAFVVVSGVVTPVIRVIGTVWVNSRTTNDVRATTHSFLAQSEYLGEVSCGFLLAGLAGLTTLSTALAGAAVLFGLTAVLMFRPRRVG